MRFEVTSCRYHSRGYQALSRLDTTQFNVKTEYMDDSWAMVTFPNGGRLSFVLKEQHPPHFCLETPDAGWYGELKEHRDGTRTSYITDPDGNVVELLLDNKV